jgi:hypothetical protein
MGDKMGDKCSKMVLVSIRAILSRYENSYMLSFLSPQS